MSPNLDPKLAKALLGECEKCSAPAHGDSSLCLHHKGKAAARQRKRRQKLASAGLCRDGCGRRVGKRKRPDGTLVPRRCKQCSLETVAKRRDRRRGNTSIDRVTPPGADPAPRGHFKLEADARSDTWRPSARYVGRDRRGAPSKEDRHRGTVSLVGDAIAEATSARDGGLTELMTTRVVELGRIQKREAHAIVADRLLRAARMLEAAADEVCPGRVAEVRGEEAWIANDDEGDDLDDRPVIRRREEARRDDGERARPSNDGRAYHLMSFAEKRARSIEKMRELEVQCDRCGTWVMPAHMEGHRDRCAGSREARDVSLTPRDD